MKKTIFIAIPFNDKFKVIYEEAISPACIANSLVPIRVDELVGHRDIVNDIEEEINNSVLVFADLTDKNPNVFYEVGYARALGKQLIVTTQKSEDVPFDLRQRRYIFYHKSTEGLKKLRKDISFWIKELLNNPFAHNLNPRVLVHGTKFDVPRKNEFWNDIFRSATKRFYLIGGSNKSWIDKGELQSNEFSDSILRIIKNDGKVKISCRYDEKIIKNHLYFFNTHLIPRIEEEEKNILRKFKSNFKYAACKSSNYGAVISDNRLVILPSMNSKQFKDESLVLELEGSHSHQYKNYLADVERMFNNENNSLINIFENY